MSISSSYPTIRPSLLLDFSNSGRLDPRVTFTRASSATYFDATGTLKTATDDQPRFDYNPSTLAAQGLLIEESRTNLQTYSAEVGTASGSAYGLTQANGTVTLNDAAAPDGTTTATSWIEDLTTSGRYISSVNFTPSLNTYYTASAFVKIASGSRYFGILFTSTGGWAGATQPAAAFELSGSGTVTYTAGSPGFISASIQPVGNGWYRCTATALSDPTSTSALRIQLRLSNISNSAAPNYAGDGTSGIYIWGAQLEVGAFPTSYIPTVASTVTREVDNAAVNTLSPWHNAAEGTIYAEMQAPVFSPTGNALLYSLNSSAGNRIYIFIPSGANYRAQITESASTQLLQNIVGPVNMTDVNKTAFAYKANNSVAYGRITNADDTTCNIPVVNQLDLTGTGGAVKYFRRLSYYPKRLSNSELTALIAQ